MVVVSLQYIPILGVHGQSVVMTLSDQRLIDKDGNLVETTLGREKGVGCDLGVGHLLF